MTRTRDIASGLASLAALSILLIGVPAGLLVTVGWPLPTVAPSWATFSHAIQSGAISDHTILKAVALVVWVAWLQVTLAAVAEVVSIIRRRSMPARVAVPGVQLLVGQLVATVLLLTTISQPRPQTSPMSLASTVAPATVDAAAPNNAPAPGIDSTAAPAKEWLVHPRESLWGIAEHALGDGRRYGEIAELNRGRPQPDGTSLQSAHLIRPGWLLQLPADASIEPAPTGTHRVVPGDTLSGIAQARLGDPARWHELWELNHDRPQTDGTTLQDPNLLRPGWLLQLPTTPPTSSPASPSAAPAASSTGAPAMAAAPVNPPTAIPTTSAPAQVLPEVSGDPHVSVPTQNDDPVTEDAMVGAGGLTLAGIIIVLERRRRAALRRRPSGQHAPLPPVAVQRSERPLIAAADVDRLTRVDLALRAAANTFTGVFPRLRWVEATSDAVVIHLDRNVAPPAGFVTNGAAQWRTTATNDELRERAGDALNPTPLLVPIGVRGDDSDVLVNLETLPTVELDGPAQLVHAAARAIATAAATAPWAQGTTVLTSLEDLGAALPAPQPPAMLQTRLARHLDAIRDALADTGLDATPAARATGHTPDAWTPLLVITDDTLDHAIPADHGCAVVTINAQVSTEHTWQLHPDGTLQIPGIDRPLRASLLEDDTAATIGALLEPTADQDHETLLEPLPERRLSEPSNADPDLDAAVTVSSLLSELDVLVRVLGEVEATRITASGDRPLPIGRQKTLEAITYLACRDSAVLIEDVQHALWPDGSHSTKTLQNVITDARAGLGEGADGPLLPPVAGGRYHLSERVATDFDLFHELVRRADEHDSTAGETIEPLLADALSLVRGEPFVGVGRSYAWVTHQRGVLVAEIIDAAEILGHLRLDRGDWRGAEWAARQGLRAFPCDERLYRLLMRAAAAAGNTAAVQRVFDELCAVVADPDLGVEPEDSIHPETVALLDELIARPVLRSATG